MNDGLIVGAVFMLFFTISGIIWVASIYYKSRERQMMIEKGLSGEDIKKYFAKKEFKSNPTFVLKAGIIIICFGIGLGFGIIGYEQTRSEAAITVGMFISTGIGFILSFFVGRKYDKNHGE